MESHVRADCSFLFNLPPRRKMLIHNGTEVHINEEDTKENSRSLNTCKPICNNLQDHTAHQTQKYHFCKCVPNFLILKDSSLLLENCLWLECKDSLQYKFSSSKVVAGTHQIPPGSISLCEAGSKGETEQVFFLLQNRMPRCYPVFTNYLEKI